MFSGSESSRGSERWFSKIVSENTNKTVRTCSCKENEYYKQRLFLRFLMSWKCKLLKPFLDETSLNLDELLSICLWTARVELTKHLLSEEPTWIIYSFIFKQLQSDWWIQPCQLVHQHSCPIGNRNSCNKVHSKLLQAVDELLHLTED
jgi:hypothetical protein